MAKFVANRVTIDEIGELKKVGKNDTALLNYIIKVPNFEKQDGEYKHVGDDYFEGEAWGKKATEFMLEVNEGDQLSLGGQWVDNDKGGYFRADAVIRDKSFDYKGKHYYKTMVSIFNINKVSND